MITTTLNRIRAHSPCTDGWGRLLAGLGKTRADDEPLPYARVLEINGIDDAIWCCRAEPQYSREWRLYEVWCVRQVEYLMADERSVRALEVAERHANGLASDRDLAAARDAAGTAARETTWGGHRGCRAGCRTGCCSGCRRDRCMGCHMGGHRGRRTGRRTGCRVGCRRGCCMGSRMDCCMGETSQTVFGGRVRDRRCEMKRLTTLLITLPGIALIAVAIYIVTLFLSEEYIVLPASQWRCSWYVSTEKPTPLDVPHANCIRFERSKP